MRHLDKSLYQGCGSWLRHGLQALGHDIGLRANSMNIAATAQTSALHEVSEKKAVVPVDDLHLALLKGELARALEICRAFRAAQRHDRAGVYGRLLLPVIAQLGRDWSEDRAGFEDVAFAYSLMHRIIRTLGESDAPKLRGQGACTWGGSSLLLRRGMHMISARAFWSSICSFRGGMPCLSTGSAPGKLCPCFRLVRLTRWLFLSAPIALS